MMLIEKYCVHGETSTDGGLGFFTLLVLLATLKLFIYIKKIKLTKLYNNFYIVKYHIFLNSLEYMYVCSAEYRLWLHNLNV